MEYDFSTVDAALAASEAAPLSAKKAMLAVLLVDGAADALAALREGGPRLVTETVNVPLGDYGGLSTADFMVSLYNQHSVQRVLIAAGDARHNVHVVLRDAVGFLRALPS